MDSAETSGNITSPSDPGSIRTRQRVSLTLAASALVVALLTGASSLSESDSLNSAEGKPFPTVTESSVSAAASCPAGADGQDGTDGSDGLNGATGLGGTDGIDGLNGATGPGGTPGIDGLNGATGPGGTPGIDGLNGATGLGGTDGIDGLDGADGQDGTDGQDGAPGPQGPSGTCTGLSIGAVCSFTHAGITVEGLVTWVNEGSKASLECVLP
jgi:hypothetical protein